MRRLGCCSWSLQATTPAELAERVAAVGVDAVQLALRPLREGSFDVDETVARLRDRGIDVCSGMMETLGEDYSSLDSIKRTGGVRPDEHWEGNLAIARADAALAKRLGLDLITFHAGFLPHDADDPERGRLLDRLRQVIDAFAEHGVRAGFETGQETAGTLIDALGELDRPTAGVNFDPANMILYDMGDPIDALARLAPWVRQIHIKDATRTTTPGTWGAEVTVGTGEVDWDAFFGVVRDHAIDVDWMIEREAGDDRVGDMRAAFEVASKHRVRSTTDG